MSILKLLIWQSIDSASWLSRNRVRSWADVLVALSIKSGELWFVLDEIVLTVLHDHLVVEASKGYHTFSFRLRIFISIFHFLFSLVHVRGPDWLNLVVKRPREHILSILDIKTWAVVAWVSMGVLRSTIMILVAELAHEHWIEILILIGMLVSSTLVVHIHILLVFFVG